VTDVFSKVKRSEVMARIRGGGNASTEKRLIALMREHGIKGWRRNRPLPGKPDFVFPVRHVAVFVDGCFWHRCPKCYRKPATNAGFWEAKINRNVERDRQINCELRKRGWKVVRIWEHQLKSPNRLLRSLARRVL
jgi:DNA mismatch endonuclease (patch repair protein)